MHRTTKIRALELDEEHRVAHTQRVPVNAPLLAVRRIAATRDETTRPKREGVSYVVCHKVGHSYLQTQSVFGPFAASFFSRFRDH